MDGKKEYNYDIMSVGDQYVRAIVSAGGTGGHIYPALAIIRKIKEIEPSSEFLYIGTKDRMEKDIVPRENIPFLGIEIKGLDRHNPFNNIKILTNFNKAIKLCKKEIKKFNPDVVIGVGGYVTSPVIYAAKKCGYKTFIHEQNSIPGVSNKFLSHYADKIGVSFQRSIDSFPKHKTIYTGNPRSEEVIKCKCANKKKYGLSDDKRLVIIVMGSLGSKTMNEKLKDTLSLFSSKDYEVLFVTGKGYYGAYKDLKVSKNVKIVPFLNDLISLMKVADLIVSRAGASSLVEITAAKLPSILVPSPYVTHNHQYKNAKVLEDSGASVIIEEKDFTSDKLVSTIDDILTDKDKYLKMKSASGKLAVHDSATKIYNELKSLVDGD